MLSPLCPCLAWGEALFAVSRMTPSEKRSGQRLPPPGPAVTNRNRQAIGELLRSGQYDRAVDFIQNAQRAAEKKGDAILSEFLASAVRICEFIALHHSTAAWHRKAIAEIEKLEGELTGHVLDIL
jgi:hypothetical protein